MRVLNPMTPGRLFAIVSLLIIVLGALAASAPQVPASAAPDGEAAIRNAWELAGASGRYGYQIDLEQVTTTAPSLAGAGKNPQTTQRLAIQGTVDQPNRRLEMTLAANGDRDPANAQAIKLEDGKAFGRRGDGAWEPLDQSTDLFAPAGDPLGFLAGVDQVRDLGTETRQLGGAALRSQHYAFTFNGAAFGEAMQGRLEAQLRERGELPAGLQVDFSETYGRLGGDGELWLDADGLPQRMLLHISLPPQANGASVAATVTSDFFDFDRERLALAGASFWDAPGRWLGYRLERSGPAVRQLAQTALVPLVEILLLLLAVRFWRRRRAQSAMAGILIAAMLISPLLEAQNVDAFYAEQTARQQEQASRQATADRQQQAIAGSENTWQPHVAPQLQADSPASPARAAAQGAPWAAQDLAAQTASGGADTDADGLVDADEDDWNTCSGVSMAAANCVGVSNSKDTDGDGLSDGAEVNQIGTLPRLADSDSDSITDDLEVKGFTYKSMQWYLDPLASDSNSDGMLDGLDCAVWSRGNIAFNGTTACPDSDADGAPDVFDPDNDNDGAEDAVDLSPNLASPTIFNAANPLKLRATNLQTNRPVFVDFQLRPTNAEHLDYSGRMLDWPANDDAGQIERVLDTTFATTTNAAIRSDDPKADYGDLKVVPMLEITMPNVNGHYAGLPVTTTYQSLNRPAGLPVDQWLDKTALDPYGIMVRDRDTTSGDLVAYAPVMQVSNSAGGNTAAFAARMLYYPEQGTNGVATWPAQHQVRLVWLVEMITDRCANQDDDPATCARQERLSVVHVYDDEWKLTGMTVSEDHGSKVAVVYEKPSQDANLRLDDKLWMVAWNMNSTFIRGRDCDTLVGTTCAGDGVRDVRVDNLQAQINAWSSGGAGIGVQTYAFEHEGAMVQIGMNHTKALLAGEFGPYANQTNPTILFAHEETNRGLNLQDTAGLSNGAALLDLNPGAVKTRTVAGMNWAPYHYVDGAWQNYDMAEYLGLLATTLRADPNFIGGEAPEDIAGKLIWSQAFYVAIHQGFVALAEVGGTPVWQPSNEALTEADYQPGWFSAAATDGATLIAKIYLSQLVRIQATQAQVESSIRKWAHFEKAFTGAQTQLGQQSLRNLKRIQTTTSYALTATSGLLVLGGTLMLLGLANDYPPLIKAGSIILVAAQGIQATVPVIMILSQSAAVLRAGAPWAETITMLKAVSSINKSSYLSPLAAVVALWGLFAIQIAIGNLKIGSAEFYEAIALTIATTIVVIIFFILQLIPIVGPIIIGLVSLVDFILMLFGIKGPQSLLIEVLADQLYDTDHIISNLDDPERLNFAFSRIDLADPALGFVEGNSLTMTLDLTNTLKYYSDSDVGEAERATFRYWLQPDATDRHQDLGQNDMDDEWVAIGDRQIQNHVRLRPAQNLPFSLSGSGVNRTFDGALYLTEAFVEPYQGCWLAFGTETDCTWYSNKGSNHLNMGEYQIYDVLPNTIGAFMGQSWNLNGSMPLGRQADFDGDGLLGQSAGGADPDDGAVDQDRDGLSDRFELSNGTNPLRADSDNDQLTDRQELDYLTNPLKDDSDGDGLVDYVEAKQGWLASYTTLGGQTGLARVWSDPNLIDADDDSLSDLEEFTFGFNPEVATDPSLIDDVIQFHDQEVRETGAPRLLAQFSEAAATESFADSSGAARNLSCAGTACPRPAAGRYGSGGAFDGGDFLDSKQAVVELAKGGFTLAAWIKTTGTKESIVSKNDGDTTWEQGEKSFYLNASGQPTFVGWGNNYIYSTVAVNDGAWHHVAVTWDYAGGSGGPLGSTGTIYIDGADKTNRATTNYAANNADRAADSFKVGRSNSNLNEAPNNFNGMLDEVAAFDRALPPAELGALMAGRYNPNDGLVLPGATLTYQAVISNTLPAQSANGHLSAATQIVDPLMANPNIALRLEALDRKNTYRNRTGSSSTATCFAVTCPRSEVVGGRDLAARFEDADETIALPDQIPFNGVRLQIKLRELPPAGQIQAIYTSATSGTGTFTIYATSDGRIGMMLGGARTKYYSYGTTTDNTWTQPHLSRFSFSSFSNMNTWATFEWRVSWNTNAPDFPGFSSLKVNGNDDSTAGYSVLPPQLANNQSRLGASDVLPAFKGSVNDFTIRKDNIDVLTLPLDEDFGYAGDFYHNTAGNRAAVPCGAPATCPTYQLTGAVGQSIRFDGVDDYLDLPTYTLLSGDMSLSLKLEELPASGQVAYILDNNQPSGNNSPDIADIWIDSQGRIVVRNSYTSGPVFTAANLNTWIKLRFEWFLSVNGATGYLHVYANNAMVISTTIGIGDNGLMLAPGRIGRALDGSGGLKGSIDSLIMPGSPGGYDVNFDVPYYDVETLNRVNGARVASCEFALTCPAMVGAGRAGGALAFDGSDDYLRLDRTISDDFTIAFWMKSNQATAAAANWWQGRGLIDGASATHVNDMGIALGDNGKVMFGLGDQSGATTTIKGGAVADNQWHHVVATRHKDSGALKLYVDGNLVASGTGGVAGSLAMPRLRIGQLLTGANSYQGQIDEIVIVPAVVEQAGVSLLMRTTYPALAIDQPFLPFGLGPQSSLVVSGTARINPDAVSSRHRFDQEAEAAIAFQQEIDYPVTDENAANLPIFLPFEDVPGATEFKNAGDISRWPFEDVDQLFCDQTACPTAGLRGKSERAASFDGANDYLYFTASCSSCQPKASMQTVAVWLKGDSGTVADFRRDDTATGMQLDFNRFVLDVDPDSFHGNGAHVIYEMPFEIPEQQWTHVAAVVDTVNKMGYIYINGQLATSRAMPVFNNSSTSMTSVFPAVGRDYQYARDFYHGEMDDLRAYDVALSAAQIQALYATSVPQLKFEFDEDQSAVEFRDSSPNGYVGKPSATPCATVTFDSLSAVQLAVNPNPTFIARGSERLASASVAVGQTAELTASAVLCSGDTLSVGRINDNGTLSTFATQPINVMVAGSGSATFQNPANQLQLRWTVGDKPLYRYNPAPGSDGKIGHTVAFDGKGSIRVDNAAAIGSLQRQFTIVAWVNPDTVGSSTAVQRFIAAGRDNSVNGFGFGMAGSRLHFNTFATYRYTSTATLVPRVWQQVAVVFNGDDDAEFYLDGQHVDTIAGTGAALVNGDDPLYIGASTDLNGVMNEQFRGQLDELMIYGREMTEAEIFGLYLRDLRWYRARNTAYLSVDADPPAVTLLSAAYRANAPFQLAVAATDPTSSVRLVDVGAQRAGATTWQGAPVCADAGANQAAWCPVIDPADYGGEGDLRLSFRAVDAVGQQTVGATATLHIDGGAPLATVANANPWRQLIAGADDDLAWTLPLSGTVSDPPLVNGVAGSGVLSDTVFISLYDAAGQLAGTGQAQRATVAGATWALDYRFVGPRPSGAYTIRIAAQDRVGNQRDAALRRSGGDLATIILDARPPSVDVLAPLPARALISETWRLSGTLSEAPAWAGAVARFHFEDAAPLADSSGAAASATCRGPAPAGDCPASAPGVFGAARRFSAALRTDLTVAPTAALDLDRGTLSAWIKPTWTGGANGFAPTILALSDGSATRLAWRIRDDYSGLDLFNGATTQGLAAPIAPNQWQHLALVHDGAAWTAYLNGAPIGTVAQSLGSATGLPLHLGASGGQSGFFSGDLDEVALYARALAPAEVYALAQSQVATIAQTQTWLEAEHFDGSHDAPQWQPTGTAQPGAALSTWQYAPPANSEGFYHLHVRGTDRFANQSAESVLWRGALDTLAPRLSLAAAALGGGSAATTAYTVTADDLFVDPDSLITPCADPALSYGYAANPARINRVTATCRVAGHPSGSAQARACDYAGHCVGTTATATPTTTDAVLIVSPAAGSVVTATRAVSITGGAFAAGGLQDVRVYANGALIQTRSYQAGTTDGPWAVAWTPAQAGAQTLVAVLRTTGQAVVTDTITVTAVLPTSNMLNVQIAGDGSGTVGSDPAGIACGAGDPPAGGCSASFGYGTPVTLTATAAAGSVFAGWSGACGGTSACVVTLDQARTVTATFTRQAATLTVYLPLLTK